MNNNIINLRLMLTIRNIILYLRQNIDLLYILIIIIDRDVKTTNCSGMKEVVIRCYNTENIS